MKEFNVTGLCVPEVDYMVDISDKVKRIKELIDRRCYFTINCARQYGKTTTLAMLERELRDEYLMFSISFEGLGDESFATSAAFCSAFMELMRRAAHFAHAAAAEPAPATPAPAAPAAAAATPESPAAAATTPESPAPSAASAAASAADDGFSDAWHDPDIKDFISLSRHITRMCKGRRIVLMVDEVDKVSNNVVFLHFLGMMREKFLARKQGADHTFHSVILAGVYDIKNIKIKLEGEKPLAPESLGGKIYNSPWNIASDFEVDMSFTAAEIATMLAAYESDHLTGMDITAVSEQIHSFTNGYPYLVSRICLHTDKKIGKKWTAKGIQEAVQIILAENNTLFDDVFKNLENSKELYGFIHSLLIEGEAKHFMVHDPIIGTGIRYGFFINKDGRVAISNRIFELLMTDYFISKDLRNKKQVNGVLQNDIVQNGRFNMEQCLLKFAEHYAETFSNDDIKFLEKHGRLVFLSYLKPLINGDGFYHIESQLTDQRRMDLVVDYGRDQYIIELKIWRGEKHEKEAYGQLCGYLSRKRASSGYLLTFDFRRAGSKAAGAKWVEANGKRIFDVVV